MTAQTTTDLAALHADLEQRVADARERLGVPGAAVAIVAGDQEDHVFSGVTSVENPLQVDARTLFQIGSTTKTYTGTAVMVLVERGLVDLDAPVRTYVGDLMLRDEQAARTVTVLQLLNHTAGWAGDIAEDAGEGDDARERFLHDLTNAEQNNPPGTVASYNNAAVNLAGLVIERVTGQVYEAAIRELLFDPLGMEQSFFFPSEVMTRRFAVGHRKRGDVVGVARPWALPRAAAPAGGIASTTADQLRWARFHLGDGRAASGHRLLTADSMRRMQQPTTELHGGALGDHVGISWLMRDIDGVRIVEHGGATNGQMSALTLVPERRVGFTILTNADEGSLLVREIGDWILEACCGMVETEPEPVELSADELAALTGRYISQHACIDARCDGQVLVLEVGYTEEGRRLVQDLLGELPEQPPFRARAIAGDRFVIVAGEAKGMKGNILRDGDGSVRALEVGGRLAFREVDD